MVAIQMSMVRELTPKNSPTRRRYLPDPTLGHRPIGAQLLGSYANDWRLHYAGGAGTGMNVPELKRSAGRARGLAGRVATLARPCFGTNSTLPAIKLELQALQWRYQQ